MAEQMPLTTEELAAIRARLDAATPGPWESPSAIGDMVFRLGLNQKIADCELITDAKFIAAVPEDVRRLLATVAEYQAALECIVSRYEREDNGVGFPSRGGQLSWAMHADAESALRGKFRQPD